MSDATAPEKDPRFNYTERKKQEGDAFQKEFRSQKEQAVTPSPDQRAFTSDSETQKVAELEELKWSTEPVRKSDGSIWEGLSYINVGNYGLGSVNAQQAKAICNKHNSAIDTAAAMEGLGAHHRAEFEKELDHLEVLLDHIRRSAASLRARLDNPPEAPAPAPAVALSETGNVAPSRAESG